MANLHDSTPFCESWKRNLPGQFLVLAAQPVAARAMPRSPAAATVRHWRAPGPLALHLLNGELSPLPLLRLAQLSCRACELRFYRTHFDVEDICNLGQRHLFSESQQEYRTLLGGQR